MKVPRIAVYRAETGITQHIRKEPQARPQQGIPSFAAMEREATQGLERLDQYVRACWEDMHPQEIAWRASAALQVPGISTRQIWAAHYRNQALDRNQNTRAD